MSKLRLYKACVVLIVICFEVTHSDSADTIRPADDTLFDTLAPSTSSDSTQLLWQSDLKHKVVLQSVMPDGRLFVVTDSGGCFMLKAEDGTVEWSLTDLGGMKSAQFVPIPNTSIACLLAGRTISEYNRNARTNFDQYYNTLEVIDYVAGTVLWRSENFGFASVHGFFFLPPVEGLMIYGRDTGKTTWTVTASLRNGEVLWRHDSLFGAKGAELINNFPESDDVLNGQQMPVLDSDSTMILLMDKEAIRRVQLSTGRVLWKAAVRTRHAPALRSGYAQGLFNEDKNTVYFPLDKSLVAVNAGTGEFVWDALPKLRGRVYQMELSATGILARGGPDPYKEGGNDYLTLLDAASGRQLWAEDFRKSDHLLSSNFVLLDDHVFVYSNKKLWKIKMVDGAYAMLTNELRFDGQEYFPNLEYRNGHFLISGTNSVGKVEVDGSPIFATTYKAPGATFGQIMGTVAIGVVTGVASGLMSNAVTPGYTCIVYPSNFGDPAEPIATIQEKNHVYILTNVRDSIGRKPGLVKVSRHTGSVVGAIKLGDRQPLYATDEERALLYYVRDGHMVECYAF